MSRFRSCCSAVLLGVLAAAAVPAGAASGQTVAPPSSDDHPDGGERTADHLTEALREATPEELERRRSEVGDRLRAAGSAEELARRTEAEALAVLEDLDVALKAAQQEVKRSAAGVTAATSTLDAAEEAHRRAVDAADDAQADLRRAAVDMFINPPQADSVRAALSGTVEEEMASTGLLSSRAESRRQLSMRRDRTRTAAAKAERDAEKAAEAADAARVAAERAASELSAQLQLRNEELRRIREDLALLRAEVADLRLTDSVLQTRLALDGLSQSGSVTAVRGPDGNWVPTPQGLPTRDDMVLVPGTTLWVHELVAPGVFQMMLAAAVDGVVLGGSAYRDPLRQIQLRASHCGTSYEALFTMSSSSCSPPTARPGQSMHERGLAIDFTEGGRVLTRSSASFRWLSENAADFGFFNLPSEPWHWSVNGR